jgi:hypothetical protein
MTSGQAGQQLNTNQHFSLRCRRRAAPGGRDLADRLEARHERPEAVRVDEHRRLGTRRRAPHRRMPVQQELNGFHVQFRAA